MSECTYSLSRVEPCSTLHAGSSAKYLWRNSWVRQTDPRSKSKERTITPIRRAARTPFVEDIQKLAPVFAERESWTVVLRLPHRESFGSGPRTPVAGCERLLSPWNAGIVMYLLIPLGRLPGCRRGAYIEGDRQRSRQVDCQDSDSREPRVVVRARPKAHRASEDRCPAPGSPAV